MAGNKLTEGANKHLVEKIEKELKTEFIPELYDRAMEKMFDEKYYDAEDADAEKVAAAKDIDMKLMADEDIPDEIENIGEESSSSSDNSDSENSSSDNEEKEPKIDPKQE